MKSDELKALSDAATQGEWGQFSRFNGPWQDVAANMATNQYVRVFDSSHDVSAMEGQVPYRVAHFRHADTAAFVEALVNAYRSGDLIHRDDLDAQLSQARAEGAEAAQGAIVRAIGEAIDTDFDIPMNSYAAGVNAGLAEAAGIAALPTQEPTP